MMADALLPSAHTRVLMTGVVSILLHAAILAGLGTPPFERALTGAMQEIEVALVSLPAPARRAHVLTAPSKQTQAVPAAPIDPAPPAARADQAFVEARHDVAGLHNPRPPYPLAARRQGLEGKVVLRVQVLANGHCQAVQLTRSSGSALLDDAALSTVRRWRFVPAMQGGQPVSSWVEVPVKFQLRNAANRS